MSCGFRHNANLTLSCVRLQKKDSQGYLHIGCLQNAEIPCHSSNSGTAGESGSRVKLNAIRSLSNRARPRRPPSNADIESASWTLCLLIRGRSQGQKSSQADIFTVGCNPQCGTAQHFLHSSIQRWYEDAWPHWICWRANVDIRSTFFRWLDPPVKSATV